LAEATVGRHRRPTTFVPPQRRDSCLFVVTTSHGAAKPISIGASDLCVFTITELSGCTSTSLYLISSFGFRENSWSFLTSNSRRPPQVYTKVATDCGEVATFPF